MGAVYAHLSRTPDITTDCTVVLECNHHSCSGLDLSDDLRGGGPLAGGGPLTGGMKHPVSISWEYQFSYGLKTYYHRFTGFQFSECLY